MKTIIFLAIMCAAVIAAPQQHPNEITIVRQEENNNIGVDGYHYSYEQSDGQKKEETGELQNQGTEQETIVVRGFFSFMGADGKTYKVEYTADADGFHPVVSVA
ncbi:flexible cuticle protein 12-like [Leptopilina boulardi]|uniref:flexible cuticle protein 12-like n=1 Tax=Leptopilina boulardi TaxID=63433 RepID=UPI0021F67732|nr:flexible cuticle protein 12-like [Leptopilina boulardi]